MKLLRSIFLTLLLLPSVACQPKSSIPSARYGAKMIFDPVARRAILFGGRSDGIFGLKYYDDLWAFDTQSQRWERIETDIHPDGRLSPGMVYDPENHQIIMFGGHTKENRVGDTWIYDIAANRWEEITPAHSPSPRSDMGMIYDEANRVVILFSGYCRDDFFKQCDDTWIFDPKSRIWTEMHPANQPPNMYGHSIVYDAVKQKALLVGGNIVETPSAGYVETLWCYSFTENQWEEVAWASANHPGPRYWQMADFATVNRYLFLFGGNGSSGFLADTWLIDTLLRTSQKIKTQKAPSPRVNAAIAYDSFNDLVILFGGFTEDRKSLQDTWIFLLTEKEWRSTQ